MASIVGSELRTEPGPQPPLPGLRSPPVSLRRPLSPFPLRGGSFIETLAPRADPRAEGGAEREGHGVGRGRDPPAPARDSGLGDSGSEAVRGPPPSFPARMASLPLFRSGLAGHSSPNGGLPGAGLPGHIRGHDGHEVYKLWGRRQSEEGPDSHDGRHHFHLGR